MGSANKTIGSFIKKIFMISGRLIKTTWLIIGSTLLLILICEMACVVYHKLTFVPPDPIYFSNTDSYKNAPWVKDYDKEILTSYNSSWKSYVYWRRKPHQGKYINIDRHGIRYTSPSGVSDADALKKLKIFMFGGSTMWGEGVRDQYTIPSLVAQDLSARKIKAEITNFGEVAYVTTQELIELVLQLERGNIPDMVVFYDGFNDVYAADQSGAAGFPQFEWRREEEYNITTSQYVKLRRVFLLNSLNRFCLGKYLKSFSAKLNLNKPVAEKSTTLEKDIIEVYLNNVKIITALGKEYGFVPLFYWQPVIFTKNKLTDFEKKFAAVSWGALYLKAQAVMKANRAAFAPYHFADISDLFAAAPHSVYIDYCHVNEDANQVIAARLARDIVHLVGADSLPEKERNSGVVPGPPK